MWLSELISRKLPTCLLAARELQSWSGIRTNYPFRISSRLVIGRIDVIIVDAHEREGREVLTTWQCYRKPGFDGKKPRKTSWQMGGRRINSTEE